MTRLANFIFGMILMVIAVSFMFSRETYLGGYQLDAFLLVLSGVLSLAAAMSNDRNNIFLINLSLGMIFLVSAALVGVMRLLNLELITAMLFDYTGGDVFVQIIIGSIFLLIAYQSRSNEGRLVGP